LSDLILKLVTDIIEYKTINDTLNQVLFAHKKWREVTSGEFSPEQDTP
jgi:hypothetical protein